MGKQGYLIDTNIAIEYIGETLPPKTLFWLDNIFNGHFFISVINKIELLGFSGITAHEEQKFIELIDASELIDLNDEIVVKTIEIRKKHNIKLPDAIIVASALCHNLTLVTRNVKDFNKISELELVDATDIFE